MPKALYAPGKPCFSKRTGVIQHKGEPLYKESEYPENIMTQEIRKNKFFSEICFEDNHEWFAIVNQQHNLSVFAQGLFKISDQLL